MTSKLEKIQSLLATSIELIDKKLQREGVAAEPLPAIAESTPDLRDLSALSILDQCNAVYEEYYSSRKPKLRIVHHLACSGGTIISKCLAAMPNVYILSEVHPNPANYPHPGAPKFMPTDISSLGTYANIPQHKSLADNIFRESVKTTYKHLEHYGGQLVLRDHSHSDFCEPGPPTNSPGTINSLHEEFTIVSLVTLRNPVDSYLSLLKRDWNRFEPSTYEEYCKRVLSFLDCYSAAPVILYEDFVASPVQTMQKMCALLDIGFDEAFEDIFEQFRVTGDSGRTGSSIEHRDRQFFSEDFENEIARSISHNEIARRFRQYSHQSG